MIGDILQKLARGQKLNETEIQELSRFGNESEFNNTYTKGLQSGSVDINARSVQGQSVRVGKNVVAGFVGRFTATTSVSSGTYTDVSSWTNVWNDGFRVSSGSIYIPETGIYQVVVSASWDAVTPAGVSYAEITTKLNNVATFPSANGAVIPSFPLPYLSGFREALYQTGDEIKLRMYQATAFTTNCYSAITIRQVRGS